MSDFIQNIYTLKNPRADAQYPEFIIPFQKDKYGWVKCITVNKDLHFMVLHQHESAYPFDMYNKIDINDKALQKALENDNYDVNKEFITFSKEFLVEIIRVISEAAPELLI